MHAFFRKCSRIAAAALLIAAASPAPAQEDSGRPSPFGSGLLGDAVIEFDSTTGTLMVITDDATNRQIEQLVAVLDRPVPQINIEVLFLEVTHNNDRDLAAEFFYQSALETDIVGNVTRDISASTDFGTSALSEAAFYNYLEQDFEATLRSLAGVGKLEVLSQPSIMAKNNETGSVSVGQEVPFIRNSQITNEGNTINTVEYEDVGILLQVTPFVSGDGVVEMTVSTEISTITGESIPITTGVSAPVFAKRYAETRVVAPDGQTIVLGGLMENNETETVRGVPVLSKIPILGMLFRSKGTRMGKTELLIFLTPKVVHPGEEMSAFTRAEVARAEAIQAAFEAHDLGVDELPSRLGNRASRVSAAPPARSFVVESAAAQTDGFVPRHSQARRRASSPVAARRNLTRTAADPGVFPGGVLYAAPGALGANVRQ